MNVIEIGGSISLIFTTVLDQMTNKFYIGLTRASRANNLTVLRPRKKGLRVEFRLSRSAETDDQLEQAGLGVMDYSRSGRYRLRLSTVDLENHRELLAGLLKRSYEEHGST